MIRPRPGLPLVLLPVMAMLLFAFGCNEDPTLPCNHLPGGRLQGEVKTGGLPSESVVMATRVIDGVLSESTFKTGLDQAGTYFLDLPAGNYIVQLSPGANNRFLYDYSEEGLGYGQIPPDTLLIDDSVSPVVANFSLGSMTLHLDLSDYLDSEDGRIHLYKRDAEETGEWRTYLNQGEATIENGQADFQVVGLLPGEYRVEIVLGNIDYFCYYSYLGEHLWMPGVREESDSPWYGVVADSVTALSSSIAQEPARIEGRISGAWLSMGLDPPYVSIVNTDSVTIIRDCQVHGDGRFGFTVHLPEPVMILVRQDGIQQWIGGPGFGEATVYDMRAGETITDIEFMQSGLRLNMVGEGFDPIFSSDIRIYDPVDLELLVTAQRGQGPGGAVAVTNLWPGDYFLYFTPSYSSFGHLSWLAQWFDRADDPADAQVVSIGSFGEVVRLDVNLERGGTIGGQLEFSSPDGGWYRVIATPADQYLGWGWNYASEEYPDFVLQGLPDGNYKFGVFPSGVDWSYGDPPPEETLWYPGNGNWDEAEILEIIDASDHVGLNILLN